MRLGLIGLKGHQGEVLEGARQLGTVELTALADDSPDQRLVASARMFANMPVGTPHSFKNESDKPARMLISLAPAGLEKMFFEVGVSLPEGATTALPPTQEEIARLLAVAPKYGIEIRLPGR